MKKSIVSILILLSVCIVICGAVIAADYVFGFGLSDLLKGFEKSEDKTVAATVNGEPVYSSSLLFKKDFYRLSTELSTKQINEMNISEDEKQVFLEKLKSTNNKTDKEILDDLIKQKVIMQEAHKKGLTVSDEKARLYAKEQIGLCKNAGLDKNASEDAKKNYEFMQYYMEQMNLTEEKYIDRSVSSYKSILEKGLLLKDFSDTYLQGGGNAAELDGAFEDYQNDLLKKAEIVYFSY